MARQESVALVDDIDGVKAHETVLFGLDGVSYEIDLHSKKAAALRKALSEFVAGARHIRPSSPSGEPTTRRRRPVKKRAAGDPAAAEIRAWAATAGVTMSQKGRISAAVLEQYLQAQQAS